MVNGLINLYKEKGFTSFDAVAVMRGILGQKKVGHTGTLDPDAEGVLVICAGSATKVSEFLVNDTKTYKAVLRLGIRTDTQDMTGKILEEHPVNVSEDEIRKVISSFEGTHQQVPPMYSALKVNGKKLYDLARQGQEIERKPRKVRFDKINIEKIELPLVCFEVTCSKGSYIRTLCNDIGDKLGTCGAMESLLRTRCGIFKLEDSFKLDELKNIGDPSKYVFPIDEYFKDYKKIVLEDTDDKLALNGNKIPVAGYNASAHKNNTYVDTKFQDITALSDKERVRIYTSGDIFTGIYEYDKKTGTLKPFKMFLG